MTFCPLVNNNIFFLFSSISYLFSFNFFSFFSIFSLFFLSSPIYSLSLSLSHLRCVLSLFLISVLLSHFLISDFSLSFIFLRSTKHGSEGETVCVTGAAGFTGSWLVMRLLEPGSTYQFYNFSFFYFYFFSLYSQPCQNPEHHYTQPPLFNLIQNPTQQYSTKSKWNQRSKHTTKSITTTSKLSHWYKPWMSLYIK